MNKKMKQFADESMGKISFLENRLTGVLKPIKPRKRRSWGELIRSS